MRKRTAILSIHDVSPQFVNDLLEILRTLENFDIDTYSSLVIPYHLNEKKNDIRAYRDVFQKILREGEPILHGFTHETSAYTNEFSSLDRKMIRQRILQGKLLLQQISRKNILGFVPPKWILSRNLLSILKEEQFKYTTTFFRIIPFDREEIFCPVINFLYTYRSLNTILAGLSALYAKYQVSRRNLIRIAIHPEGFATRKTLVEAILKKLIRAGYEFVTYRTFLNLADT